MQVTKYASRGPQHTAERGKVAELSKGSSFLAKNCQQSVNANTSIYGLACSPQKCHTGRMASEKSALRRQLLPDKIANGPHIVHVPYDSMYVWHKISICQPEQAPIRDIEHCQLKLFQYAWIERKSQKLENQSNAQFTWCQNKMCCSQVSGAAALMQWCLMPAIRRESIESRVCNSTKRK